MSFRSLAPEVDIFAEVYIGRDWKEMYTDEVDVLLTVNDYKTTIMARNALCPGFSALLETLMASLGSSNRGESRWLNEYMEGCGKEVYNIKIPQSLLKQVSYNYSVLVELIYSEFSLICLGVSDKFQQEILLNPCSLEICEFIEEARKIDTSELGAELFFQKYCYILVIADSLSDARKIRAFDHSNALITRAIKKLHDSECSFSVDYLRTSTSWTEEIDRINTLEKLELSRKHEAKSIPPNSIRSPISPKSVDSDDGLLSSSTIERTISLLNRSDKLATSYQIDPHSVVHNDRLHLNESAKILLIQNASQLTNHVIVIGIGENYYLALREFRRPLITKHTMHPVVLFGSTNPIEHQHPEETDQVYYIKGSYKVKEDLAKLNLENSFSIIVFVDDILGEEAGRVGIDADLFHLYTTISVIIKDHKDVFFSMELCTAENLLAVNLKLTRDMIKKDEDEKAYQSTGVLKERKFLVRGPRHIRKQKKKLWEKISESSIVQFSKRMTSAHDHSSEKFWDMRQRPMALPIYASGKAFVSQALDSLLIQVNTILK